MQSAAIHASIALDMIIKKNCVVVGCGPQWLVL